MEEAAPPVGHCNGPIGTTIVLYVTRTLPSQLAAIVFKQGPIGMGSGQRTPSATMLVQSKFSSVTGGGTAPGSVYTLPAPTALCMAGSGFWTWDLWLLWPNGTVQGDIDDFTVQCP